MNHRSRCSGTSGLTLCLGDKQLITGRGGREGLREQGKLKVNFKMSAAFIGAAHVQYLKKNIDSQFRLFLK